MNATQPLTRPASLNEWVERRQQIRQPAAAESIRHALAYQAQPTDLFIAPYMKCGTIWLQQIVHSLRTHGDMDFDDIVRVMPWLEMAQMMGLDLYAQQRGGFQAFKSHLTWDKIPKGGRYIVAFRDPKDALVSLYNFLNGYHWQAGSVTITEYARASYLDYQGDSLSRSYWGHLLSWWEQRQNPSVLLLCYEEMKADLPATVQTIANFLRIELDPALLTLVVNQASLDFMLAHKPKFSDRLIQETQAKIGFTPPSDTFTKVKTGRVGDHRAELPTEISAEMDAIWQATVAAKTGLASYQALHETLTHSSSKG